MQKGFTAKKSDAIELILKKIWADLEAEKPHKKILFDLQMGSFLMACGREDEVIKQWPEKMKVSSKI